MKMYTLEGVEHALVGSSFGVKWMKFRRKNGEQGVHAQLKVLSSPHFVGKSDQELGLH